LGFIVGPALGGFLSQWGTRVPLWAAAALCFVNLIYGWLVLPESLSPENRRAFSWKETNPLGALRVLGKYPMIWGLTGTLILTNISMQFINSTWVPFTTLRFGWNEQQVGILLAVFGAVALVYQLGIAPIVLRAWGERRTMLIGLCAVTIEFLAYALATKPWMFYAITLIGGIGLLGSQATQGVLSQQVGDDEQGTLQGALSSLASLSSVVAPIFATELFAAFTRPNATWKIPGITFFVGALLNLLALIIAFRVLSRMRVAKAA
jgi:DHA1 family tetracycline resistance protein-like MFS transporter